MTTDKKNKMCPVKLPDLGIWLQEDRTVCQVQEYWQAENGVTPGYTRSPGLSARLSPSGCCHKYYTPWCWQWRAATTTLAWLLSLFMLLHPQHIHTNPYSLYLLSSLFGVSPLLVSAAGETYLSLTSSYEDMSSDMHHLLTLTVYVEIWWVNHVKVLGAAKGKHPILNAPLCWEISSHGWCYQRAWISFLVFLWIVPHILPSHGQFYSHLLLL